MNDVESTSSPPEGCAAQTGGASSRTSKKKLVLLSGAAAVVGVAFGLVGYYAADGGGDKAIVRASLAKAGRDGGGKGGGARASSATETPFSARNSRAKSGKVAKSMGDSKSGKGEEICLERGEIFAVEGPTAPIVGPAGVLLLGSCGLDFDAEDCPYFYEPFFMQNGGSESAFSFIADPDSPLGDGALCGGKTNDGMDGMDADKFSFLYLGRVEGESQDLLDQDLTNLTLGDLESLSYDFSVLNCPTSDADDICPEQFYVNVYLRESIDSANFCDCNMVFSAAGGGEENGGYTTVTVTPFTKVSSTFPCSGNDGCGGKTSLYEYLQENPDAVLGQGGFPTFGAPFQFNVGDTAVSRNGIFGCYDNIRIGLKDEPTRVYELEPEMEEEETFVVEGLPTTPFFGPAGPLLLGPCGLAFDPDNCPYFYEPFFMQNGNTESYFLQKFGIGFPDGALCGGKTNDGMDGDKFSFIYLGMEESQDLTNLTLGDLESLSYDFSVLDCPTSDADDICPEQFYVNVYLRESIDSANYCDCNMVFSAAGGGEENGGYTTVTVTPFTKVSSTFPCSGRDGCGGKTSLFEYLQENPDAVLGQGGFPTAGAPFQFNVGDSAVSGNGISGCYDNIRIGLKDEPNRVYKL